MGQLMKPITDRSEPVVMTAHAPPAHAEPERMFGIAVRLPDGRGLGTMLGGLAVLLALMALVVSLIGVGGDQALIEAKDAHIASLKIANERAAEANQHLADIASNRAGGMTSDELFAFGSVVMIAAGLSAICIPGGGFAGLAVSVLGVISLFALGSA